VTGSLLARPKARVVTQCLLSCNFHPEIIYKRPSPLFLRLVGPFFFSSLCLAFLTIMPLRSRKSVQYDNLFRLILATSVDIMPYTFYSLRHLKYYIIEDNSRCAECVRYKRSCNASGVLLSLGISFLEVSLIILC
jgi:hypothetical protein